MHAELVDMDIINLVLKGDFNAYSILVERYQNFVFTIVLRYIKSREDAEEVAQDAFVKAYSSLHSFKSDARFSTWLYRIVVNTALNKKKLKKQYPVEISDTLAAELPSDINTIFATQITSEHRKHIQAALKAINTNERLCITLYYLNELSVEEIHELTGITTSNIKVLLYRGRKNLYTALHRDLKNEITSLIKQ